LYDWTGTFQEIQEKIDQFENPEGLVPWIKINVREEKIQGNEYANLLEMIQIAQQSWNGSAIILDHSLQFTGNHPQAGMHQAAVPADSVTPELIFDSTFHRDHFEHIEILKEIFDGLIEEIQMNEGGQY
jgi:hypothetical protein